MDREGIIEFLKTKDDFFKRVDFKPYSLEELRKIRQRWEELPATSYDKNGGHGSKRIND
jgi:hypothetical protein